MYWWKELEKFPEICFFCDSSSPVCVQLGYLLVVGKAEVEGGDQWAEQMGLRLVVCHPIFSHESTTI